MVIGTKAVTTLCTSAVCLPRSSVAELVPEDRTLARLLPLPAGEFFRTYYGQRVLLPGRGRRIDPASVWSPEDLPAALGAMLEEGLLDRITPRTGGRPLELRANASVGEAVDEFERRLRGGTSFTIALEYVSERRRPLQWLADALFNASGLPSTIHIYASAPGAQVLPPHTDMTDIIVWQLAGHKEWRVCIPGSVRRGVRARLASGLRQLRGGRRAAAGGLAGGGAPEAAALDDAQLSELQELRKRNIQGGTVYAEAEAAGLGCTSFHMSPGDVLYMPKGVIHYALTNASAVSYHLTLGLDRRGQQWLDIISFLLLEQGAGAVAPDQCPQAKTQSRASSQPFSQPASPQSSPLSAPSSPSHPSRVPSELASARLVLALMRIYSETRAGIHLREAVPAWLLVCWRPWNRGATAQPGGGASCAELHAALLEVYVPHVARFEAWMGRMAGARAAEVAIERAERERSEAQRPAEAARRRRDGGDARPRPHVWQEPRPAPQSEYWWGGDLRAVERLRDAGPLARAFQWMGNERGVAGHLHLLYMMPLSSLIAF